MGWSVWVCASREIRSPCECDSLCSGSRYGCGSTWLEYHTGGQMRVRDGGRLRYFLERAIKPARCQRRQFLGSVTSNPRRRMSFRVFGTVYSDKNAECLHRDDDTELLGCSPESPRADVLASEAHTRVVDTATLSFLALHLCFCAWGGGGRRCGRCQTSNVLLGAAS